VRREPDERYREDADDSRHHPLQRRLRPTEGALALRPRASGTGACGSARASASRSFGSFASPKPTAGIATTPIIVNHAATVSSLIIALLLLASMITTVRVGHH
jgi:hypothetical protein